MFEKLKFKSNKRKVQNLIELGDYEMAYNVAMKYIFLISNGKLETHHREVYPKTKDAMYILLSSCGMADYRAKVLNARYWWELSACIDSCPKEQQQRYEEYVNSRLTNGLISQYDATKLILESKFKKGLLDYDTYSLKLATCELVHLHHNYSDLDETSLEEKELSLREDILMKRYRLGEIDYLDYKKSLSTLRKEKWFDFKIGLDSEDDKPNSFLISFDFNKHFVDWLKNNDEQSATLVVKGLSEEAAGAAIVEDWAKRSLITLAATMLVDDDGDTFKSYPVNEPEGTIVQRVAIDKDEIDGMTDQLSEEQINTINEMIKNRSIYR